MRAAAQHPAVKLQAAAGHEAVIDGDGTLLTRVPVTFSSSNASAAIATNAPGVVGNTGVSVDATVMYNAATRTATLTPVAGLDPLADYTARVTSTVTSIGGSRLAGDVTWTFRTGATLAVPSAAYAFTEGASHLAPGFICSAARLVPNRARWGTQGLFTGVCAGQRPPVGFVDRV